MLKHCATLLALVALLFAGAAQAQGDAEGGLQVTVTADGFSLFQMAVPDAVNLGDVPDTRGVTEALSGTVVRDLGLTGHFNLIDKAAYPKDGMEPVYRDWFNMGTQGLVKIGYRIVGTEVTVDMRLYSVDGQNRVAMPAPYNAEAKVPLEPRKLRAHAHGFVNELLRHYTKAAGFFGTQIVCVKRVGKSKELYMVSPDGKDEYRLTKAGGINMLPSYGGGRIYFTSFRNGGAHLFQLSKNKVQPFAAYKGLNTGAALSPNGKFVAATLSKDGNPEIFLLDPNSGKVVKRLTNSWGIDTSPAWSPDGTQIAFVSDRHGSPQIWVMGADGSNQRRLTFQGDYNQTPDWNPRGDTIIFTARDERNVFDLFTVSVADGSVQRLTQNQGNNEEPSWSPDGRYFVFTSTRSGESKLYLSTADGRRQTRISAGKGEYFTPSWGR